MSPEDPQGNITLEDLSQGDVIMLTLEDGQTGLFAIGPDLLPLPHPIAVGPIEIDAAIRALRRGAQKENQ